MENPTISLENTTRMVARRLSLYWGCVVAIYFLYLDIRILVSLYDHLFFAPTQGLAWNLLYAAAIIWLPRKFELVGGIAYVVFGLYLGSLLFALTIVMGLPWSEAIFFLLGGSIPMVVIGVMFIVSWIKARKAKALAKDDGAMGKEVKPKKHTLARMNRFAALYGLLLIVVLVSPPVYKLYLEMDLVGVYPRGEEYNIFKRLEDVIVQGDYAYANAGEDEFHIFDVSNPADPVKAGSYISEGHIVDFVIRGKYAYLSSRDIGLEILDISDPTHPFQVSVTYTGYIESLVLQDNLVFIGESKGIHVSGYDKSKLHIFDVSDPTAVVEVGAGTDLGLPMAIYDHYLFTVRRSDSRNDADELNVVDVADPHNPVPIHQDLSFYYIMDIEIGNDILYLASNFQVTIFDISDPSTPVELGFYRRGARSIAVSGSYLYAVINSGIMVLDVSDPGRPRLAARSELAYSGGVFVSSGHVFVADMSGLFIFETKP